MTNNKYKKTNHLKYNQINLNHVDWKEDYIELIIIKNKILLLVIYILIF